MSLLRLLPLPSDQDVNWWMDLIFFYKMTRWKSLSLLLRRKYDCLVSIDVTERHLPHYSLVVSIHVW